MGHAPRFLGLVNDAKSRVKETNVADVKRRMDAGEKFVLVDTREDNEWANGHLPGAVHLSKGIIERDIEKAVPDAGTKVILYCGGGFRSALAADNLQKMGYTNVESMDGGWKGWLEAGFPTQKERRMAGAEGFEFPSKNSKPHRLKASPAASQSNCWKRLESTLQ